MPRRKDRSFVCWRAYSCAHSCACCASYDLESGPVFRVDATLSSVAKRAADGTRFADASVNSNNESLFGDCGARDRVVASH